MAGEVSPFFICFMACVSTYHTQLFGGYAVLFAGNGGLLTYSCDVLDAGTAWMRGLLRAMRRIFGTDTLSSG